MGAKEIADKYIARDGAAPAPPYSISSSSNVRVCVATAADISVVASFLAWHGSSEIWGGVRSYEAWEAFCRMLELPAADFRKMIRGD